MLEVLGVAEAYRLIAPLLSRHFQEVEKFNGFELKPDLNRYQMIEAAGRFIGLVAIEGEEVLGYSINFLLNNIHCSDLYYCQNDMLYVIPERRCSRIGLSLIRETVRRAKAQGAQLMVWSTKPKTNLHALLPRLGYELLDVIWAKRL